MKTGVLNAEELGSLLWNLEPYTQYTPGVPLAIELSVSNPTDAARTYSLLVKLVQGGVTVHEQTLTIDGETEFEVEAEGAKSYSGELTFDYTDATLSIRLWDVATEESIDSVSTFLYYGYVPPSAPGIMDWIMMVMMMGICGVMVYNITKTG
jgi:hypothetical protein